MPFRNTLAYLASSTVTKEKSFITLTPGRITAEAALLHPYFFALPLAARLEEMPSAANCNNHDEMGLLALIVFKKIILTVIIMMNWAC